IIMSGVNPVYTLADGKGFADALKKAKLSVSFALREDETASVTTIAAAAPHFLESWGDVMLVKGLYSLSQPTIRPLFNTKQFEESMLNWNGNTTSYYDYLRANAASYLGGSSWNKALHDGLVEAAPTPIGSGSASDMSGSASALASSKGSGMELVLYTKVGMGDGQQANNPWLQEFPDPITRVSWDNYVTVSKADAERIGP